MAPKNKLSVLWLQVNILMDLRGLLPCQDKSRDSKVLVDVAFANSVTL